MYFISLCNSKGLPYKYDDDWYDFTVYDEKVEVKTCHLSVFNGHKRSRSGRWDFTDADTRNKQYDENIWVCLLVQHHGEHLVYGFVKARTLKKKRYFSIAESRQVKLYSFEQFVKQLIKHHDDRL